MSISHLPEACRRQSEARSAASLYAALGAIGLAVVAAPVALLATLQAAAGLSEPLFLPLSVVLIAVEAYLAVRISGLFAHAAATGRFPPRCLWRVRASTATKLAATLLLAPWRSTSPSR